MRLVSSSRRSLKRWNFRFNLPSARNRNGVTRRNARRTGGIQVSFSFYFRRLWSDEQHSTPSALKYFSTPLLREEGSPSAKKRGGGEGRGGGFQPGWTAEKVGILSRGKVSMVGFCRWIKGGWRSNDGEVRFNCLEFLVNYAVFYMSVYQLVRVSIRLYPRHFNWVILKKKKGKKRKLRFRKFRSRRSFQAVRLNVTQKLFSPFEK